MMVRCPICGVESERMDLHESTLHTESKEEVRAPGSIDQRDGFGMCAAPGEKQELPPLTDYEMADAFEWLRGMALGTSVASRRAYVALRAWSELKAAQSASGWIKCSDRLPKKGEEVLVRGWGEAKRHYIFEFAERRRMSDGTHFWGSTRDSELPKQALWFEPIEWLPLPSAPVDSCTAEKRKA